MTLEEIAKRCVVDLTKMIGPGFHPDNSAAEYIKDGKPLFTSIEATKVNALVDLCFSILGDGVYEAGLEIQQKLLRGEDA